MGRGSRLFGEDEHIAPPPCGARSCSAVGQFTFTVFLSVHLQITLVRFLSPVLSKRQCVCHWLGRRYLQAVRPPCGSGARDLLPRQHHLRDHLRVLLQERAPPPRGVR